VTQLSDWRTKYRLASLIAYSLSLLILYFAEPVAEEAYNGLCSSQGMAFPPGETVGALAVGLIVFAIPLFLARSNAAIFANLTMGSITVLAAAGLLGTAGDTPYECFTQAGTYEDHTSGLDGFGLWLAAATFFSYVLLLIDLAIWGVKRLDAYRANTPLG
jgi:hypothetical protein